MRLGEGRPPASVEGAESGEALELLWGRPAVNGLITSRSVSGWARWKPRIRPDRAPREAIASTRSRRWPGRTDAPARFEIHADPPG
ncbi:hypothetical protein KSE_75350 [Kitasatospora setae KM-6054]|uniref:Uncharacterized protein n=1 Tax=Kitasatospora setae (strain ATCC 33774 / DSM 43861 / JCM 3304 / KCC A-0304 / NBRC 14216 / KM-6054) TaxID=452652 RepID=E4NJY8_KITSK|nr:hypothetical protein KSE_75350 [Kitasatospora setae KM-6054]